MKGEIYVNFIDFEKAFDKVHREKMWNILSEYGLPNKYVQTIRLLYENYTARIEHEGKLTQKIKINSGVRQGCILSPLLFIIIIDWVMERTADNRTGITWDPFRKLEDLEFADDICLLTQKKQYLQEKTSRLTTIAKTVGMKVNGKKTKILTHSNNEGEKINIEGEEIEEFGEFCYLGSVVTVKGGCRRDIDRRIGQAQKTFNMLRKVWSSSAFTRKTKLRLFKTNVKSVLLYGAETWNDSKQNMKKLQRFINKCLRIICGFFWPLRITNERLWQITGEEPIEKTIKRLKWKWIGHTLRKPQSSITRQALDFNAAGKRRIGRPADTWKRSVNRELAKHNLSWNEAKRKASNREEWKKLVQDITEIEPDLQD